MKVAKLFKNGQSQALRLPKEFRFQGDSVLIKRLGNLVILMPKDDHWNTMFKACSKFTKDFMGSRDQGGQQDREDLN